MMRKISIGLCDDKALAIMTLFLLLRGQIMEGNPSGIKHLDRDLPAQLSLADRGTDRRRNKRLFSHRLNLICSSQERGCAK